MIKLNDKTLIVGQIKQTLKDFNLPKCHCNDGILVKNSFYIKDNKIFNVIEKDGNLTLSDVSNYIYNNKYLNVTDNFKYTSLYYNRNTHKYLGNYLRFLRDYNGVNLMSMYNCNIDKVLDESITFKFNDNTKSNWNVKKNNIYIVPVKFNQVYTIGINSSKAELCCCLYDEDNDELLTLDNDLFNNTYTVLRGCSVTSPQLYDKLKDYYSINKDIFEKESLLKLLIKVDSSYNSSIVVLEGDYTKGCHYDISNNDIPRYILSKNSTNINDIINSQIRPQLLSSDNISNNYLLADRLVEYITNNPISPLSESYDIKKLQDWCLFNGNELLKEIDDDGNNYVTSKLGLIYSGIWSESLSKFLYELTHTKIKSSGYDKTPYDSIGYLDKDLERKLEYLGDSELNEEKYNIKDYGGIV